MKHDLTAGQCSSVGMAVPGPGKGSLMELELQTRSLVDAVAQALREQILTGEIPADAQLTEQGVAKQGAVARPTAKAAIDRLTHEGLLRRGANRSARVPRLDASDVRDLYFSRMFLEREVVAKLAERRTVPDSAHAARHQFKAAVAAKSLSQIVDADIAFHVSLVEELGSRRVSRMYAAVIGEAHLCMAQVQAHRLLSATTIDREHGRIVKAILAGDSSSARDLLEDHLSRAEQRLVGYLEADGLQPSDGDGRA